MCPEVTRFPKKMFQVLDSSRKAQGTGQRVFFKEGQMHALHHTPGLPEFHSSRASATDLLELSLLGLPKLICSPLSILLAWFALFLGIVS